MAGRTLKVTTAARAFAHVRGGLQRKVREEVVDQPGGRGRAGAFTVEDDRRHLHGRPEQQARARVVARLGEVSNPGPTYAAVATPSHGGSAATSWVAESTTARATPGGGCTRVGGVADGQRGRVGAPAAPQARRARHAATRC